MYLICFQTEQQRHWLRGCKSTRKVRRTLHTSGSTSGRPLALIGELARRLHTLLDRLRSELLVFLTSPSSEKSGEIWLLRPRRYSQREEILRDHWPRPPLGLHEKARRFGAKEIVDPRPFAVKSIATTYQKYPKTSPILPAMGYGAEQMKDLEATIDKSDVDMVVVGTPIDLTRVIKLKKPYQRVRYELQEIGQPTLQDLLIKKFGKKK